MPTQIEKTTLTFLRKLSKHNNREWFNTNKDHYLRAQENLIEFADDLLVEMHKHDHIETRSGKESLLRIYRDTRFSHDKTPYKSHFSARFRRATKRLRGGYYFEVGPQGGQVAGGFFGPNREDLLRIRRNIASYYPDWGHILNQKELCALFGQMQGEKLITAPRGFSQDHPAIELLRCKRFYFERKFTVPETLSANFLAEVNGSFRGLRPFFDFMSEVLTTDGNGVSLVD